MMGSFFFNINTFKNEEVFLSHLGIEKSVNFWLNVLQMLEVCYITQVLIFTNEVNFN